LATSFPIGIVPPVPEVLGEGRGVPSTVGVGGAELVADEPELEQAEAMSTTPRTGIAHRRIRVIALPFLVSEQYG
jgi:hypothetical protein